MGDNYQNYVDGVWTPSDSGTTFEDRNPADPDDVVGEFPDSAVTDAERAIDAATDAAEAWAATPAPRTRPLPPRRRASP